MTKEKNTPELLALIESQDREKASNFAKTIKSLGLTYTKAKLHFKKTFSDYRVVPSGLIGRHVAIVDRGGQVHVKLMSTHSRLKS